MPSQQPLSIFSLDVRCLPTSVHLPHLGQQQFLLRGQLSASQPASTTVKKGETQPFLPFTIIELSSAHR
jgi:hypothetical protein